MLFIHLSPRFSSWFQFARIFSKRPISSVPVRSIVSEIKSGIDNQKRIMLVLRHWGVIEPFLDAIPEFLTILQACSWAACEPDLVIVVKMLQDDLNGVANGRGLDVWSDKD